MERKRRFLMLRDSLEMGSALIFFSFTSKDMGNQGI